MSYSISTIKDDLSAMLHGTTISKVTNINSVFNRAARNVIAQIDPEETVRIENLTNPIFDAIYDYSAPSDLKGDKIIDIRPQVNRTVRDQGELTISRDFDAYKTLNTDVDYYFVQNDQGVKSLRISKSISPAAVVIHSCDSLTANGSWAADGTGVTNLTLDTQYYITGGASLNFDLASGQTTGYIENSTLTAVDLDDYDEKGTLFVYVYIPDTSLITSFNLRWGSSSSNYWSRTVTTAQDSTAFKNGWNLLGFNWNGATETGTVDPSAVDYLRFTVNFPGTSAETDIRVDSIVAQIGTIFEIEYYSRFLFRTSGGTWQETADNDTDLVNLDTDSYNLFLFECLLAISQQLESDDARSDLAFAKEQLFGDGSERNPGLYKLYKRSYPSRALKKEMYYYRIR